MDLESRESQESSDSNQVSRRDFLKKVGIGAAGLGAASMLPSASALDFESGSGFSFGNQTSINFELGSSGNLNLKGGDLQNAGAANVDKLSVGGDGPAESFSEIGGSKGVADAVVTLEGGTPTAYRSDGTQIAQNTDAGAVVQTAIDHAISDGRGKVKIAPGEYSLQSAIAVKDNLTISGAGPDKTIFNATAPGNQWVTPGNGAKNFIVEGFTQDGNEVGKQTGVQLNQAVDSVIRNVASINHISPNGSTDSALRMSRSFRCIIDNCYVENSTAVSLATAIDAEQCLITNCVVRNGIYNSAVGFVHGISIEKSKNCAIQNCHVEAERDSGQSDFGPALNVNNADNAVVAGNLVRNVDGGLNNTNGPCYANVYANNSFHNCNTSILIGQGGAGAPQGTLVVGNVFDADSKSYTKAVDIGDGVSVTVANNMFVNYKDGDYLIRTRPGHEQLVLNGNVFRNVESPILWVRSDVTGDPPTVVTNNYTNFINIAQTTNAFTFRLEDDWGIVENNVIGVTQPDGKPTVQVNPINHSSSEWFVRNNYIAQQGPCINFTGSGWFHSNIVEGNCTIADTVDVRENYAYGGGSASVGSQSYSFTVNPSNVSTYTGDGTTGRSIPMGMEIDYIVVEDSGGTLYDAHRAFGAGYVHNDPTGELTINGKTITVGDNGGDADPNTDTESYTFYAR